MNETESAPRKKRGRAWLAAGIAVVLVAAAAAGFFWWRGSYRQDSFFDVSALTGALPGKSEEEVIAELNRVVDEGMFNIAINSYITFPDAKGEGVANIENVPGNRYNMTVSIVLDDTGETVYQSKGIKPGQYIQKIRLDEELPEGFYYATAVFTAYAQDEAHTRVGQAAAKIQLEVGG
ncbi:MULTISPECIES: hypothetical protein [Anaerotruncus]|uniref:Uncharacterized protein n=2 Tax=Anaerotruncus TaxID=244127 RepID=A0A498CJU5_9FIRM|nr:MULTISPECIES: hypothetical protein [Anaerotruncus]MBC3939826.1 hypothetical protein [Anaerotruncus massiliensis (ex Togo et al. 2019)]RLL07948.1 hypothetical protein D4A47_12870 [Anaerotruncus massiliensis (ex Liu et al. 2021)]